MTVTFDPSETRKEWPGWTWAGFEKYYEERLPAVWYKPPFDTIPRTEMIRTAWESPLSYEGMMIELHQSLAELVDDDRIRAAQRFGQNMGGKVAPAGSFSIQGDSVPALVIPNVYQVAIEGTLGGQDQVNVIGVRGSASGLHEEAAAAVLAAFKVANGPLAQKTNLWAMREVRAMDLSSVSGGIAVVSDATTGSIATTLSGYAGASALIKWNGGSRSRSTRGRLYHGGLGENDIGSDGRTLLAARQTGLVTAYNNFRASLSAAGFTLCVISRKDSAAYDVTSVAVESILATQRRRVRS